MVDASVLICSVLNDVFFSGRKTVVEAFTDITTSVLVSALMCIILGVVCITREIIFGEL